MGIQPSRPPSHIPNGGKCGIIRLEASALLKRKRRKPGAQPSKLQSVVVRFNVELKISPGSPYEGLQRSVGRAIRHVFVINAEDLFPSDFVSVAFFSLGILQRLGVSHSNVRVFSAADGELHKCSRQLSVVEKNADFLIRPNLNRSVRKSSSHC